MKLWYQRKEINSSTKKEKKDNIIINKKRKIKSHAVGWNSFVQHNDNEQDNN
jgi:hypothetical protein